ncbi:hypothetical protein CGC20_8715 [Leishmania donovani]|uniref:Uncharacterized protein n=1 Tax=Leishmania donovani TaxID=5661 RepID=A0A504X188_LEIDO|nr:hypothetical protein CGC20_8715 [Leishmania donovani]
MLMNGDSKNALGAATAAAMLSGPRVQDRRHGVLCIHVSRPPTQPHQNIVRPTWDSSSLEGVVVVDDRNRCSSAPSSTSEIGVGAPGMAGFASVPATSLCTSSQGPETGWSEGRTRRASSAGTCAPPPMRRDVPSSTAVRPVRSVVRREARLLWVGPVFQMVTWACGAKQEHQTCERAQGTSSAAVPREF